MLRMLFKVCSPIHLAPHVANAVQTDGYDGEQGLLLLPEPRSGMWPLTLRTVGCVAFDLAFDLLYK